MDHTRKLVLIPEALYKQLMPSENVEKQMENTLRNKKPAEQKVSQYNSLLKKYRRIQQKAKEPLKVKLEEDVGPMKSEDIVSGFPPALKEKGKSLLALFKGTALKWDEKGQITYNGEKIHYSNIQDLVNDSLKKRKGYSPHGWETFARALSDLKVPRNLVSNADRWRHITASKKWKSY